MRKSIVFAILVGLASTSWASEGDLLVDLSPTAVFQSTNHVSNPGMGGTLGLTWGFNDHTDIGGYFHFDNADFDGTQNTIQAYTFGLQSWFTPMSGDIRPQVGGRMGLTYIEDYIDGSVSLDLAVQARVLAELTTRARIFVGGEIGGDLGSGRRSFATVDFGLQFLL